MTTRIDDRDPRVVYKGNWVPNNGSDTVTSTNTVGDSFTVSFQGTNIAVFGTFDITSAGVVTSYSVDGAPPAQVTSQAGSLDTPSQQFWRSPVTFDNQHKLVVTMVKINSDPQPGEGTVWFDYFLVTDPSIPSSAAPPASPSPSSQETNNKSEPIGAVVGAVIGGLFFLLALAFLFLLYQRRARIQIVSDEGKFEYGLPMPARYRKTTISPFILTEDASTSNANTSTDNTPVLLVGPPLASRKSMATIRPGTGRSSQHSLGSRTEVLNILDMSATTIPDEPPPLPPAAVPALSRSTPVTPENGPRPVSRDASSSTALRGGRPKVDMTVLSPASSSRGPESSLTPPAVAVIRSPDSDPPLSPVQHVDSGVRAAGLAVSSEAGGRVELPPVYSPI